MATKKPYSILLIVEDVKRRNNLSSRLRSQQCVVEAATGGFHTLSLLEEKPTHYEMVLIVGEMEDMGAYELTSLLRTTYSSEQLKVLYLYPSEDAHQSINVQEAGADHIVEDNNRFDMVMAVINSYQ